MIKNIVFDIGNVLVKFNWEEYYRNFGWPEDVIEKVAKATVLDPFWNEMDMGNLSDDEILAGFIERGPDVEKEIRQMFVDFKDLLIQFDYTKGWIRDLQNRGYKVYCLSNMSYKAVRECDALNFLKMVDGYVLSCDVRMTKPDLEIYKKLLNTYNLKAEECVFLDDLEPNIEASRKLGFTGIVFTDLKSAVAALSEIEKKEKEEEALKPFESKYSKPQRIGAFVCLGLITLLYLATIVLMCIDSEWAHSMLKVALGCTILLPCLTWAYIWMIGKLVHKDTIADFHLFKK